MEPNYTTYDGNKAMEGINYKVTSREITEKIYSLKLNKLDEMLQN